MSSRNRLSLHRLRVRSLVLGSLLGAALALPASAGDLRAEGGQFVDAAGRVVVLRGVNIAGNSKVPPFAVIDHPALLDPLPAIGMNVLRFLFTWEAFEPEPGVYNQAYLDYYRNAVDWAWQRGIYVILDIHQDGFSRYTLGGCGEGFPVWALPPEVPIHTPDNSETCKRWGLRMNVDGEMQFAWSEFFRGANGIRNRYLDMMEFLAGVFAGHPGVIGYDLLNEPWGDELTELPQLYEDTAARIRAQDPNGILFIEPTALVSSGQLSVLPQPSFDNFSYAAHYYEGSVVIVGEWFGNSIKEPIDQMKLKAAQLGGPLFVGEFGAPGPGVTAGAYIAEYYRQLNKGFVSSAQWVYTPGWTPELKDGWNDEDFSIVDDAGKLRGNFRPRAYPQKTAGIPISMEATDAAPGIAEKFEFVWIHHPGKGATEIYLPIQALFGGADLLWTLGGEALTCSYETALERRLLCTSPVAGLKRIEVRACAEGECL